MSSSPQDLSAAFSYQITGQLGAAYDLGDAPQSLTLAEIGNVVFGDLSGNAAETVKGGLGLTTVLLGNGADTVRLQGALNTIVLGDGNDVVDAGKGTASVTLSSTSVQLRYAGALTASFSECGLLSSRRCGENIGFFNGGSGNIGAFNGLGDCVSSSGDNNVGVFNGLGNGGAFDGDGNVGAFNGNLNGVADSSPSDGAYNGDGNIGVLNGNLNGSFVTGLNSGNDNGGGNLGLANGNFNGDGTLPGGWGSGCGSTLTGGFDTIVVGNGADTITALAGLCTIDAGNGNDKISIGGLFDTVVAGNGNDVVTGTGVSEATVVLGNGSDRVTLSGNGNSIVTGSGHDILSLVGNGDRIDAGASPTFNEIHVAGSQETFVLPGAGEGYDKIFGFRLGAGDWLDLASLSGPTGAPPLRSVTSGGDTWLETVAPSGHVSIVAELVGVTTTFAALKRTFEF